jgi:threonine/homoserine/homoserine lactone efflux protein
MLQILIKGITIGLITGMPLGAIGAICMKTTLVNGASFGLASGLGSCTADSIYAGIAALGLTIVSNFLARYQHYFRLFGGIILAVIGIHIILSKHDGDKEDLKAKSHVKAFLSTFLLAIANPATVFSFIFVFSSYGSKNIGHGFAARTILIIGVFCGSLLWWIILIAIVSGFRNHINEKSMSIINKILGCVIVISGLIFIISITNYKKYTTPIYVHLKLFERVLKIKPHRFIR